MNEQIDICTFAPNEPDCDIICAWVRFPNQILLYAQGKKQKLHRISCKDCLAGAIRLLEATTERYGKDYRAMLIQQAVGENARMELFQEDTRQSEEDVMATIVDFIYPNV